MHWISHFMDTVPDLLHIQWLERILFGEEALEDQVQVTIFYITLQVTYKAPQCTVQSYRTA